MTTNTAQTHIHPFEAAGLGKAPFTWTGVSEDRGPHRTLLPDGTELLQGAPGQPMGVCDFCGNGIAECHHIRSADGHNHIVGCDCIAKISAKGERVRTAAEKAHRARVNARARARREEKAREVKAELEALLSDPAWCERAASRPHPRDWRAEQGDTGLDYARYMLGCCGAKGRDKLLRELLAW